MTGKDKGKKGKIIKVITNTDKVIIEGLVMRKKHMKPTRNAKGSIIDVAHPIPASNVMLVEGGKPARAGYKMVGGKKIRVAVKSGKEI